MCVCNLENILTESDVDLLYGTVVCGAAVTDGRINHLIVENKSGRSAIGVKTVVDATGDADDITTQVLLSHKTAFEDFLKKRALCENYSLATLPAIPQVRMTRRINGESTMNDKDMHTVFTDSVGLFPDWRKRGPVYELRFGALHGKKVKNLICAGRNISVTDAMWDITRVIPVCAVSGQAAGTAAALFSDFTEADISLLQHRLKEVGVVLHESELH